MINSTPNFVGEGGWNELFATKLNNWVQGCLHGKELGAPGEAGLAVQKIIDGVYRSAGAGKEVTIK
jgi:predicted dehydrogenase